MQENVIYRYYTVYVLILGALITCYWNSFSGTWLYDDVGFILKNENIRLTDLDLQGIWQTLNAAEQGCPRPLAFLSFGLNYYFSGYSIFGYHLVNFIIHLAGAWFLFHVILDTLRLDPVFKNWSQSNLSDAALLGSVFWALSPLHVFAVTNIWQRVTTLCGVLMIMTLFFYIRARLAHALWRRLIFAAASVVSFGLSLLTKENAAMLPVAIVVYDLLFFQEPGLKRFKVLIRLSIPVAALAAAVCVYTDWSWILSGYAQRTFTLAQRLLTEPRVLVFYLSLIAYPLNSRLALLHDIDVSRSLTDPWTTVFSILFLSVLAVAALKKSRQYPFVCYAVLFFFINHLIESSIVPLELVYEYRNYLPSIFIYALMAAGVVYAKIFFENKKAVLVPILVFSGVWLACQGHTVYLQNSIMQDSARFWLANLEKSPGLSCIYSSLARELWNRDKDFKAAFQLLKQGEKINHYNFTGQKATLKEYLGTYHFFNRQFGKAIAYFQEVLPLRPDSMFLKEKLIHAFLYTNQFGRAYDFTMAQLARSPQKDKPGLQACISLIQLKQGAYDRARLNALDALRRNPGNLTAMAVAAEIYRKENKIGKAIGFFENILGAEQTDAAAQLALTELYCRAGRMDQLYGAVVALLDRIGRQPVSDYVETVNRDAPVNAYIADKTLIIHAVRRALQCKAAAP